MPNRVKKIILSSTLWLVVITACIVFLPDGVAAQNADPFGVAQVDDTLILEGQTDIRVVIARIIRVALGLLGIIALGLMIYGGFVYMTSGGNEDKVEQGRKILINATIGLAIILSSLAIVQFVLNKLAEATGSGQVADGGGGGCRNLAGCNNGGGGGGDCVDRRNLFVVRSLTPHTPNDGTGMTDVVVRAVFSNPLSENIRPEEVFKNIEGDGGPVQPLRVELVSPRVVQAVFAENTLNCEQGQDGETSCLKEGSYGVEVNSELVDIFGQRLEVETDCGIFPRESKFAADKDERDQTPPTFTPIRINGEDPAAHGQDGIRLPKGAVYPIETRVTDRVNGQGGVGYVHLRVERTRLDVDEVDDVFDYYNGPHVDQGSHGPYDFAYNINMGENIPVPRRYTVTARAFDIDGNSAVTSTSFVLVGKNCFNGVQDPGEEDIDIGGECPGVGACQENWQCASQECREGQCVARPIIDGLYPLNEPDQWNGAAGNFVTIVGKFFGQEQGLVSFGVDGNGDADVLDEEDRWVDAAFPQCGIDTWSNSSIVVVVPGDDLDVGSLSSIRVRRAQNPDEEVLEDTTTDERGPRPGPRNGFFEKNEDNRPALCALTTPGGLRLDAAAPTTPLVARGRSFGDDAQGNSLRFAGFQADIEQWAQERIVASVPRLASGVVPVQVEVGQKKSNAVPFRVLGDNDANLQPVIESVDPVTTTPGSLVTLTGRNFGDQLGHVYVAATQEAVVTCGRPDPDPSCHEMIVDLPLQCGDGWGDTQIIIKVPGDIPQEEQYAIAVFGIFGNSDGSDMLGIVNGPERPGLCRLEPSRGPSPLPQGGSLSVFGVNLADNPLLYFWKRGSVTSSLDTWIPSRQGANDVLIRFDNTSIITRLPIDVGTGQSMISGPIKAQVGDQLTNGLNYTVAHCEQEVEEYNEDGQVHPLLGQGYHCCTEGAGAGQWIQNQFACPGEVRQAGYVWRFTTGIIPDILDVEQGLDCRGPEFPSPTPWERRRPDGINVCLNAEIAVRFTLNIDAATLNNGTVRVYTCGNGENPDCGRYQAEREITDRFGVLAFGINAVRLAPNDGVDRFEPNTWYRVTLADTIRAQHRERILGRDVVNNTSLVVHRELDNRPDGVAYYFDFKTGNSLCQLASLGITPSVFSVGYLGMVQDPRFEFDALAEEGAPAANPLYYYLWGRADQQCHLINIDRQNWEWGNTNRDDEDQAEANKTPGDGYQNTRATVRAEEDRGIVPAFITAVSSTNLRYRATSTLDITLGDPQVVSYWPNCEFACTNASIGVRFNRPMMQATFNGGIVIQQCDDELCRQIGPNIIPREARRDRFSYEVSWPAGFTPATGTWYLVTVQDTIKSIARVENGVEIEGPPLEVFQWRFRTKSEDGECRISTVSVAPDPFRAHLVGQKTRYSATPLSSPDECNPDGQRLDPWLYGWNWSSENNLVARTSQLQSLAQLNSFCTVACLPLGSAIQREQPAYLCGNGVVDPGEDCDIGLGGVGQQCSFNCLRPGSDGPNCGDGAVQSNLGEECDPENEETGPFCTNRCVWQGSAPVAPLGRLDQAWCGSGSVTFGEDCDSAIAVGNANPANQASSGCNAQCLHVGTPIARSWCDANAGAAIPGLAAACATSVSACGNQVVEKGEDCEVVNGQLRVRLPTGGNRDIVIENPESYCAPNCTLQNICGVQSISHAAVGGPRCDRGAEGCFDDCTLQGSSPLYSTPSLCGDGQRGVGENNACEVQPGGPAPLGQNPLQVVTAVGQGAVNQQTGAQETRINASAVRDAQGPIGPVVGLGDYALQCGYEEQLLNPEQQRNVLLPYDWDMESGQIGQGLQKQVWITYPAGAPGNQILFKKSQDRPFRGALSGYFVVDNQIARGIQMIGIPVRPGRYEFRFRYRLVRGQLRTFLGIRSSNVAFDNVIDLRNDISDEWQTYSRQIVINQPTDDLRIIIATGQAGGEIFVDDVEFLPAITGETRAVNNCPGDGAHPGNRDNYFGVAGNSCCAPRPGRMDEYPRDGAGLGGEEAVCLNTAITVTFREEIDPQSIQNNIILAQGYDDPAFDCAATGQQDVTARVGSLLAYDSLRLAQPEGFWKRMWTTIRNFFARLVGGDAYAAPAVVLPRVWCSGSVTAVPEVSTVKTPDGSSVTSTIYIGLQQALESETTYAVILRGGPEGIKNIAGVSVREQAVGADAVYASEDIFIFRTSDKICKLKSVTVVPPQRVFTAPGEQDQFVATAHSINDQQIGPIPNVYFWTWQWAPVNHPLFQVGVPPSRADEPRTTIAAGNLEGGLSITAQARVTADSELGDNNHVGRVFTGVTKLTALFCERPWPAREAFPFEDTVYNVSFGYCADDGRSGVIADDFPYITGSLVRGQAVVYGDINGDGRFTREDTQCYQDVLTAQGRVPACMRVPLRQVDINCSGDIDVTDLTEATNRQQTGKFTEDSDSNANRIPDCLPEDRDIDIGAAPARANTLKRILFFNDQNDDVIGFQIFRNDARLAARSWVLREFPFVNPDGLQDIQVGGYDGVIQGTNIYINALNQTTDANRNRVVYSNVYQFSINADAQERTQEVLRKILDSLEFNTNITNFGYCLAPQISQNVPVERRVLPRDINDLGAITTSSCQTDFDCRKSDGTATDGTNGVCSNAKTRFLRDWQRLNDIGVAQQRLALYQVDEGGYPSLESGSYIPQYSNSRWPLSWGRVGSEIGSLPLDPINQWSQCGRCSQQNADGGFVSCVSEDQCPGDENVCQLQDAQTCWDAGQSQFICPLEASVYEYEVTGDGSYQLHVPLEYFEEAEGIVRAMTSSSHFTTERWCQPRFIRSPIGARCGDGVVSQGEQCDPPLSVERTNRGRPLVQAGTCEITQRECLTGFIECGEYFELFPGSRAVIPGVGQAAVAGPGFCINQQSGQIMVNMDHSRFGANAYVELFRCQQDADCQLIQTYGDVQQVRALRLVGAPEDFNRQQFSAYLADVVAHPMRCIQPQQFTPAPLREQQCSIPEANQLQECLLGQDAPRACNRSCEWEYGVCRSRDFICGNGVVEANEACDDGERLNGTYGHCAGPQSRDPNTGNLIGACQGQHPNFCANNRLDFTNRVGGAGFDVGDIPHEFCDEVDGICQYIVEGVGRIKPNVFLLIDRSGSMRNNDRWASALRGLDQFAAQFADDMNIGIGVFGDPENDNGTEHAGQRINFCNNNAELHEGVAPWMRQVLAIGEHPVNAIQASYQDPAVAPTGGAFTPTAKALRELAEGDFLTVRNDRLNEFRPKRLILLTDGEPTCGDTPADVVQHLTRLREEQGVQTFILGFDFNSNNLQSFALAGGTERPFTVSDGNQLFTVMTQLFGCERYAHVEGNTCAADCQSFGGYCGDGVVQRDGGERCDDGNRVDDDTCSNTCRVREAAPAQQGPPPQCGNARVDEGEVCDTGSDPVTGNGVACIPGYGESCIYCSADCQERLSIDPPAYCGNGRVDSRGGGSNEACDVSVDGRAIRPPTPAELVDILANTPEILREPNNPFLFYPRFFASCPDKGVYECNNQCQELESKCVTCATVANAGAIPQIAILNVMTGQVSQQNWARDLIVHLMRPFNPDGNLGLTQYGAVPYAGVDYRQPRQLTLPGVQPERLETNQLCNGEYAIEFNIGRRFDDDEPVTETRLAGKSFFPYPVNGEGRPFTNELVVSPAVPQHAFRVAVRWKKEADQPRLFLPAIYNGLFFAFNGQSSIVNMSRALSDFERIGGFFFCNRMQNDGRFHNEPGYWWPDEDLCTPMSEIYMHEYGALEKTETIGMSIDTNLFRNVVANDLQNPIPNQPIGNIRNYAVFVESIIAVGGGRPRPISGFEDQDITLDFYGFRQGQSPRHSIFVPIEFKLNRAQSSGNRGLAKYWHVFNLVYDQASRSYSMQLLRDAEGNELSNGRVVTDYADVMCGIPNHPCPRGGDLRQFGIPQ